ncbi:hypothetical protein [Spirosoma sp.]|uniref:hypothetical protein n=1 Tax=Spirosoma sp. TaxID=1899569 RepID=UPI00262786BF|nr:hypothetical protein [Spirosoma sp.]MCX6216385.1 hypothetical protein [Spirosoma sp.]
MSKRKRKMVYQVKPEWLGKIKLQTGKSTIVLDGTASQETLAELHQSSVLAGLYIELVAEKAPQIK